jgi:hypothetical protein
LTKKYKFLLESLVRKKPKNLELPNVTFNKIEFDPTFELSSNLEFLCALIDHKMLCFPF